MARDGGVPQLNSTTTASIAIERVGVESPPPETWAVFTDTHFSVEVLENTSVDTIVKRLTVLNKPDIARHLRCAIDGGNEDG